MNLYEPGFSRRDEKAWIALVDQAYVDPDFVAAHPEPEKHRSAMNAILITKLQFLARWIAPTEAFIMDGRALKVIALPQLLLADPSLIQGNMLDHVVEIIRDHWKDYGHELYDWYRQHRPALKSVVSNYVPMGTIVNAALG